MSEDNSTGEELRFNLVIKGNSYELSTSGTLSEISSQITEIAEFIQSLNENIGLADIETFETPTDDEIREAPTDEVPVIRATRSTQENITLLFNTEWGRTPRSSAEVARALEMNAVPDQAGAVSVYLRRLTQRGVLRRIQREGRYHYIVIPEG